MSWREKLRALDEAHGEKLRYLVVGAWNTVFSVVLYNIALTLADGAIRTASSSAIPWIAWSGEHGYLIVFWLVWVVAVVQSTVTMKYLAFRSPGDLWPQVGRAYVIYLPAQGVNTAVMWVIVALLHLSPRIGQLFAIALSTIFSYLGHKYFTFRAPVEVDEALEHELERNAE